MASNGVKTFKRHLTKKGYDVKAQGDVIRITKGTAQKEVSKRTIRSIKVRTVPRA